MKPLQNIIESSILSTHSMDGMDVTIWIQTCIRINNQHPKPSDYTWDARDGHIRFNNHSIYITDLSDPTILGVRIITAANITLKGENFSFSKKLTLISSGKTSICNPSRVKSFITIQNLTAAGSGDLHICNPLTPKSHLQVDLLDTIKVYGAETIQSIIKGPKNMISGDSYVICFYQDSPKSSNFNSILSFLHNLSISDYINSLPEDPSSKGYLRSKVILPSKDKKELIKLLNNLDIVNPKKNMFLKHILLAEDVSQLYAKIIIFYGKNANLQSPLSCYRDGDILTLEWDI